MDDDPYLANNNPELRLRQQPTLEQMHEVALRNNQEMRTYGAYWCNNKLRTFMDPEQSMTCWRYPPLGSDTRKATQTMVPLIQLRWRANLARRDMARRLSVDRAQISRMENAQAPSLVTIERWAHACGFRVEIVFCREGDQRELMAW